MSTTYIQPLTNVRGRMTYTELGEGRIYRDNVSSGTDRVAAQFGDASSREEFVEYCEEVCRRNPGRSNEGYEVRVSWGRDELDPDNPDDIQMAIEHTYKLCKAIAPDSRCWLTAHTDGEGGCVHVHAIICNNDESSGGALAHGMTHWRVERENDRLSIEEGLSVVGQPAALKEAGQEDSWAERRVFCQPFEVVLGDKVAFARDGAADMEDFRARLESAGVELGEKSGDGRWTYFMRDPESGRKRRRLASKLAADLDKDAVGELMRERYEKRNDQGHPVREAPVLGLAGIDLNASCTHQASVAAVGGEADAGQGGTSQTDSSFGTYFVTESDVSDMAVSLQLAYIKRSRKYRRPFANERYKRLMEVERDPSEQLAKLREEVDAAREKFRDSKEARDALKGPYPRLTAGIRLFARMGCNAKDSVSRMMADMTAMMLQTLVANALREQRESEREEAERRLYESRRDMWDVEKRMKAAEKALANEDGRVENHLRMAEQHFAGVVRGKAMSDMQYQ